MTSCGLRVTSLRAKSSWRVLIMAEEWIGAATRIGGEAVFSIGSAYRWTMPVIGWAGGLLDMNTEVRLRRRCINVCRRNLAFGEGEIKSSKTT
jgi:hypothetical protein